MNELTARWIQCYNEIIRRKIVPNAKGFCDRTGLSTSTITEILKGRTGAGAKTINATLAAFPDLISEQGLMSGKGSLFKKPDANKGLAAQIRELKELLDLQVISKREFELGKKKILS